jgi:hypothetical protein
VLRLLERVHANAVRIVGNTKAFYSTASALGRDTVLHRRLIHLFHSDHNVLWLDLGGPTVLGVVQMSQRAQPAGRFTA